MQMKERNARLILPQATINALSPMFPRCDDMCCCLTLTLARTGVGGWGQTRVLGRTKPALFFHYAAALIYRKARIQLNGAVFSFAFEAIFSRCSHWDGSGAFRWNGGRSGTLPASLSHTPQLEFTAGTDSAACSTLTISGDRVRLASHRVSRVQQRLRVRHLRHIFGFAKPP